MVVNDLVPQVAIELPGCDDFIVERILREEIANLYRNNCLYLHRTTATLATDGSVTFTAIPTDTQVHEVRAMETSDRQVQPVGPFAINDYLYNETTQYPSYVFMDNEDWVVRPLPRDPLQATVVLQVGPTISAATYPDVLASRHRTLWQHLVLTRLQAQAGQAWSNPKYASFHASEASRLLFEEKRRIDGWSSRRAPVVRYGGI